jgi:hypothetical protein
LTIAIPVTRERFMTHLRPDSGRDFVRAYAGGFPGLTADALWRQYEPYAALVSDVAVEVEEMGVAVAWSASLDDWRTAMLTRDVVTLVAHSTGGSTGVEAVEFGDGLHPVDAVASAVPSTFAGVVDLTLCCSAGPGEAIKRRHRDCLIIINEGNAKLDYRLVVYRHAMRVLRDQRASYIDVVTRLHVDHVTGGR